MDLESVLAGNEFLPPAGKVFKLGEMIAANEQYRNVKFGFRWEPATPDFLQIYLREYLPYLGHQVPYRLIWNISHEVCSRDDCIERARLD